MTLVQLPLKAPTPQAWVEVVLGDFDTFLKDHASCERKAAALCLSFIAKYSEHPFLAEPMVALAREELDHFAQVYRLITRRGLTLGLDERDPYVNALLKVMRPQPAERLLDRLIVSGLIEARGYERFLMLADALEDPELKDFYETLGRAEAGHYRVFLRIAERLYPAAAVEQAVERLATEEARLMLASDLRPAVH